MTGADLIALIRKQPIGFVCGLVSLACAVALYWRSDLIDNSQKEYEAKAKEAARVLANVKNSVNLPEQATEAQALSKELENRLMRAGQLASNLQYFYKLETENEVKLLDLRQGAIPTGRNAPKTTYLGVPYSLAVQGTFAQVTQFIARLESGRHFCRFNSVNFSKLGGTSSGQISVTLNIELLGTP